MPFIKIGDMGKAVWVTSKKMCYTSNATWEEICSRKPGRQKEHLKRARAVQEVDYPGGTWRRKGAEEKKAQVYAWRQEHPEGRKADCHRDTGLDPKTIRKWWDTVPEGHITVKIRPSQALSDLLVEEFKKGL